jgi:hypothetical protein
MPADRWSGRLPTLIAQPKSPPDDQSGHSLHDPVNNAVPGSQPAMVGADPTQTQAGRAPRGDGGEPTRPASEDREPLHGAYGADLLGQFFVQTYASCKPAQVIDPRAHSCTFGRA